jgi:C-terminal processing protease CtpA/Prc
MLSSEKNSQPAVYVLAILPLSPLIDAGMLPGDLIVKVNGKPAEPDPFPRDSLVKVNGKTVEPGISSMKGQARGFDSAENPPSIHTPGY